MKLRRLLSTILFFLASIACGSSHDRSRVFLSGGVASESPTPSVVRIAIHGKSFCTGVLASNDLVITAAHCLALDDPSAYTIVFPMAKGRAGQSRSALAMQKLRSNSLLYFPNFDIAWLRLSAPAPLPYQPATILGDSQSVTVGTEMKLLGTGNETPCNPNEIKCLIVQLSVRLNSIWSSPHLINLAVIESSNLDHNNGTCPGDSGGRV